MINFRAFLTGSHAYGKPTPDSDIDLVVFVTEDELLMLQKASDDESRDLDEHYIAAGGYPLRFGKLNLLCVTDENRYKCWWDGTRYLKKRKPVVRVDAVEYFRKLREERGFYGKPGEEK